MRREERRKEHKTRADTHLRLHECADDTEGEEPGGEVCSEGEEKRDLAGA